MEVNENVSLHGFLFRDMVKKKNSIWPSWDPCFIRCQLALPFTNSGFNIRHKLFKFGSPISLANYMQKCSLALGISTLTSSQLFDIKNSCKLIPINFEYNCTHQDISIQMKTPQLWGFSFFTCMEVLFSLWHASYKMTWTCVLLRVNYI